MGATTRLRFREYTVPVPGAQTLTQGEELSATISSAECVTGAEADCGAASGDVLSTDELVRWIATHQARTGHEIFEQITRRVIRSEAGMWL
ncbi:DUF7848 domain-containing protein [Streptacidiphilus fuscans]|uniref:DUF7848 domain-containing protein n=1 Tax=Streptacidiphilus fuscans TaxID=2789292 RepID=A0A931B5N5_9ACTN|nr:hypothetical protein [Streptacidiphilus fuscans]MBF9068333.1 hypothetical protein [Streptacidiphilus fuscans]